MPNLTEHFTLAEMTFSDTATRKGIDNTPTEAIVVNLALLCERVLEPLRDALGPVHITSGYRSPDLNVAIGGSRTSSHMEGKAADVNVPGKTLAEVFNWLQANAPYDQIIREFPPGGWVHCSYDIDRNRLQGLLAVSENGKTVYRPQDGPVNV